VGLTIEIIRIVRTREGRGGEGGNIADNFVIRFIRGTSVHVPEIPYSRYLMDIKIDLGGEVSFLGNKPIPSSPPPSPRLPRPPSQPRDVYLTLIITLRDISQ